MVSVISALVPPSGAPDTLVTAWALVATALLAVLMAGRGIALPMVLGAVAMAVTHLLSGMDAALSALFAACLLPAMLPMLLVSVFGGAFVPRGATMEPDATEQPEPIRVGSP